MTSTPLPEQGGFKERLDEQIELLHNSWFENDYYPKDPDAMEFKSAIRTLILEEIIGQDEYWDKWSFGIDGEYEMVTQCEKPQKKRQRDTLRAEQRKKLGEL